MGNGKEVEIIVTVVMINQLRLNSRSKGRKRVSVFVSYNIDQFGLRLTLHNVINHPQTLIFPKLKKTI